MRFKKPPTSLGSVLFTKTPPISSTIGLMRKNLGFSLEAALFLLTIFVRSMAATTWYVDSAADGNANGTSWANAWTAVEQVSGISPGDTVYFSGGPKGSTRIYNLNGNAWYMVSGPSASSRTIYQIGQDPSHNGTAIFQSSNGGSWLAGNSSTNSRNLLVSGDAGDGEMHFAINGYARMAYGEQIENWHISHVDCGNIAEAAIFNPANGIEIDHCYFYITDLKADRAISARFMGETWDQNRIHHCTIYAPNTVTGLGPDFFQGNGTGGFSFFNNTCIGYLADYRGGQHQDGWQGLGNTSYVKIYNNFFIDVANYPIFGDAYYGGFSHVWIYKNICCLRNPAMARSDAPQAGGVGVDSGYVGLKPCVFDDVIICNNIAVDYKKHLTFGVGNITPFPAKFTSCYVVNNIGVNSGSINTPNSGATVVKNNVSLTREQGMSNFAGYTEFGGADNDLRPTSAKLTALALGADIPAYFKMETEPMSPRDLVKK